VQFQSVTVTWSRSYRIQRRLWSGRCSRNANRVLEFMYECAS